MMTRTGWGLAALLLVALTGACTLPQTPSEVVQLKDDFQEGDSKALSKLLSGLESRDPEVRAAAVKALAELGEDVVAPLEETVRKDNERSGPALLALGLMGDPANLAFIRTYKRDPTLGGAARQAERDIEELIARQALEERSLDAMNLYLEHFPEGSAREQIEKERKELLADQAFRRLGTDPAAMKRFLTDWQGTARIEEVRQQLVLSLFSQARAAMDRNDYTAARAALKEATAVDPRRSDDVEKLLAEAWLREGDYLLSQGQTADAVESLEEATRYAATRAEAEKRMARVLVDQARALLGQRKYAEGVAAADRAVSIDPAVKDEVSRLKSEQVQALLSGLDAQGTDRVAVLKDLMLFGPEVVRPMEVYLGNLFVQKDYKKVEEVMTVLAALLGPPGSTPDPPPPVAAVRLRDSLSGFIRAGVTTAVSEVSRLFSSPEFSSGWRSTLEPLNPRTTPLVLRVEEVTGKYIGLLRLGLGFRVLLGEQGMEVVTGTPLKEELLRSRVRAGDIGADPSEQLLTRVQLAGAYAAALGPLIRTARETPRKVLDFAVALNVPPTTPDDWMTVAEGVSKFEQRVVDGATVGVVTLWDGSTRTTRVRLVLVESDPRQVTLSVYDPVLEGLASGTPEARVAVEERTLAMTLNLARLVWGLYPGIGSMTVMLGTTSTGRFEPQTRAVLERKGYEKLDAAGLRAQGGMYGPEQASLLSVRWARWAGGAK